MMFYERTGGNLVRDVTSHAREIRHCRLSSMFSSREQCRVRLEDLLSFRLNLELSIRKLRVSLYLYALIDVSIDDCVGRCIIDF